MSRYVSHLNASRGVAQHNSCALAARREDGLPVYFTIIFSGTRELYREVTELKEPRPERLDISLPRVSGPTRRDAVMRADHESESRRVFYGFVRGCDPTRDHCKMHCITQHQTTS